LDTYVFIGVEVLGVATVLEEVCNEVVLLVGLEVQEFVARIFVVQEHEHLHVTEEREFHRLLQKTLLPFAVGDLLGQRKAGVRGALA